MSAPRRIPQRMNVPHRRNDQHGGMFPHTITVYNVEIETDNETFQSKVTNHITILCGVLLDDSKAVNVQQSGLEGADAVNLYIPFSVDASDGVTGKPKKFVSSLDFWKADDKAGIWTMTTGSAETRGMNGSCFFVKGEIVHPDLSSERIEMMYDHVYDISKIDEKDFGSPDMQHWEVGGV